MSDKKTDGKIPLAPGEDPNDFNAGNPPTGEFVRGDGKIYTDHDSQPVPTIVSVEVQEMPSAQQSREGQKSSGQMGPTDIAGGPYANGAGNPGLAKTTAVVANSGRGGALEKARVELDARGLAMPSDLDAAYRVAEMWIRGGVLPKWVKSAAQALAAAQFCRAYGIEPLAGIQHLCEIGGRFAFWGEAPLGVVRRSGQLGFIDEYFIDKDYARICTKNKNLDAPILSAVVEIQRSGSERKEFVFTEAEAKIAIHGLEPIWKAYRGTMMMRKARAKAIKAEFGDLLMGMPIAEYDHEYAPDLDDGRNKGQLSAKEKLEARYGKGSEVSATSEANALPHLPTGPAEDANRSMPRADFRDEPVGCMVQHNPDVPGASR